MSTPTTPVPAIATALPFRQSLDVIQIQSPCPADWNAMRGDDRSRFCDHCQLHVHDLSALTLDAATRLVCESAGRLCVRFARDAAGTVMTLDYAKPKSRKLGWKSWSLVGMGGAVASWAMSLFVAPKPPVRPVMVAGALVCPSQMTQGGTLPPTVPIPPMTITPPSTPAGVPTANAQIAPDTH